MRPTTRRFVSVCILILVVSIVGGGLALAFGWPAQLGRQSDPNVGMGESIFSVPVLVGAGDIATCPSTGDEATAGLIDDIDGTIFTTGDNAYPDGTDADFENCYEPSWGRHKPKTYPSPGNHEYHTPGASGYFDYFGAAAGDPAKGYYSYNLSAWHVVVLNSNIAVESGSAQHEWLRADLASNTITCTVAYWHHPLFSSGLHGNQNDMKATWDALYAADVDVVVNGHDHDYERFALQDPSGEVDPARGIREFVVGTGGSDLRSFETIQPNSEVRDADTHGVLKLTLNPTSYDWEFVPVTGETFTDSGSGSCH